MKLFPNQIKPYGPTSRRCLSLFHFSIYSLCPVTPPPLVKLLVAPLEGRVGMRWKETIGKQSLFSKYWIWLNNLSLSHHSVLQVGK